MLPLRGMGGGGWLTTEACSFTTPPAGPCSRRRASEPPTAMQLRLCSRRQWPPTQSRAGREGGGGRGGDKWQVQVGIARGMAEPGAHPGGTKIRAKRGVGLLSQMLSLPA